MSGSAQLAKVLERSSQRLAALQPHAEGAAKLLSEPHTARVNPNINVSDYEGHFTAGQRYNSAGMLLDYLKIDSPTEAVQLVPVHPSPSL